MLPFQICARSGCHPFYTLRRCAAKPLIGLLNIQHPIYGYSFRKFIISTCIISFIIINKQALSKKYKLVLRFFMALSIHLISRYFNSSLKTLGKSKHCADFVTMPHPTLYTAPFAWAVFGFCNTAAHALPPCYIHYKTGYINNWCANRLSLVTTVKNMLYCLHKNWIKQS